MTALELVWRCTDPEGEHGDCPHYEAPQPQGGLRDRCCVHRRVVPVGDCTHARARQEALENLLDVLGEARNGREKRVGQRSQELLEQGICGRCDELMEVVRDVPYLGFDGEPAGGREQELVCVNMKCMNAGMRLIRHVC